MHVDCLFFQESLNSQEIPRIVLFLAKTNRITIIERSHRRIKQNIVEYRIERVL